MCSVNSRCVICKLLSKIAISEALDKTALEKFALGTVRQNVIAVRRSVHTPLTIQYLSIYSNYLCLNIYNAKQSLH